MLTFEYNPPKEVRCDCCDGVTVSLTRFVLDEDGPFAVYYARFGRNHPDRVVSTLISVGDWADNAGPWDRVAISVRIWVNGDQYAVAVTDASESPWQDSTIMGRILNREEALARERIGDVFHITDHIVEEAALFTIT
jgi:hypothetical protein